MSVRWRLCCCLGVWVCLLYNVPLTEGQFSVIGSAQPIVAVAGDDVILPCHLEPALSAVDMTIEWSRPDLTPRYVHVHQDGRTLYESHSFISRTALFVDELKNGNLSLKLSRVRRSDEGSYRCFFFSQNSQGKESFVQLIVGAVSIPEISIVKNPNSRVDLQCESRGWYPEPEVDWLDSEGHVLSAGPTETLRDPDGTYTVRRLVTVEKTSANKFTCRVQQQHINQTREKEINIPDEVSRSSLSACDIGVSVAMVMLVLAGLVVFYIKRELSCKEEELMSTQMKLIVELTRTRGELRGKEVELMRTQGELRGKEEELMRTQEELRGKEEELKITQRKLSCKEEELMRTQMKQRGKEEELMNTQGELRGKEEELLRTQGELRGKEKELISTQAMLRVKEKTLWESKRS